MSDPFTIRIYIPDGDPEGVRIIDRLHSTGTFFTFPRSKFDELRSRKELEDAGIYILSGYSETDSELPTIYIGQAENVAVRIDQHDKGKDFWDRAVVFVTTSKMNSTHAKWLEYALIKRAVEANRCILENGNNPQEPRISEAERADMKVFLKEIYQTLPLVGLRAFETPQAIVTKILPQSKTKSELDTVVVPAQKDGFERVFLGQNEWWAIRIAGGMLEKIKYIAAYQTAPVSAITHSAQVERIEPYGEEGKYRLIFSKPAIKLDKPIVLGDAPSGTMQGPRYTIYEKLKKAKQLSDLF